MVRAVPFLVYRCRDVAVSKPLSYLRASLRRANETIVVLESVVNSADCVVIRGFL